MASDPRLQPAIQALRAGDRSAARTQLQELTQHDPALSDGWLWLAAASDNPTDKQTYLERVLLLQPADERARSGLRVLGVDPQTVVAPLIAPVRRDKPPTAPLLRADHASASAGAAQHSLAPTSFASTGVRTRAALRWQWIALVAALVLLIPLTLYAL